MTTPHGASTRRKRSTGSERVRASRDGDRFHYTWAAVRLLQLLSPTSALQQISIEGLGVPFLEEELDGSEVIDLVEFHGPPGGEFTLLEVRQLKHSTLHPDDNLTLSEVGGVLKKFAKLDNSLRTQYPQATIRFSIVTNKPIATAVTKAIEDLATGQQIVPGPGSLAGRLLKSACLNTDTAASLCLRLELRGREPGVIALRQMLALKACGLTADTNVRVSASLVDLVASRASTESSDPIRKADVLAAFGCREDDLAPAPCLLDDGPYIVRDVYRDLADRILESSGAMIVTAEGGIGKSTFARELPNLLSDRADVIVYDCFGQGNYRNPAHPRHRHRDGLVQLATELAGLGLCFPIVPFGNLPPEEYTKAFVRCLDQVSETLLQSGDRQLVIVVDAADNAVLAAEDNADSRPFVRDLLRLQDDIPPNVRIVLTCRPERLDLLKAPDGLASFELPAFTSEETAKVVSNCHPSATNLDVAEIHYRTAGNPRVLSTVLSETATVHDALCRVTSFASATTALDSLIREQVNNAFNNAGRSREKLERVVQLLTLLRPSVPLDVLADLADTQPSMVRSFISDLGRGLILDGQSVQFLDEATETYFQKQHPATQEVAVQAALQLRMLSDSSAYAASSLPEVLWSANLHDELLDLVATDDALPSTSDIERAQVEHLRVEFGLRAAVRLRRSDSIVQLAMRAGAARAGKGRQLTVIRDNPDLAGPRMDIRTLSELIASRELPECWPGSTLGSEAALLAHTTRGASTARSRVRQADSAIAAWVCAPREPYTRDEDVTPEQVAHIALAILRTEGPALAAHYLAGWTPARFVLESSAVLARMLLSSASDQDVSVLIASSTHTELILGILGEMQRVGMTLDAQVVSDLWTTLEQFRSYLIAEDFDQRNAEDTAFRGAAWLCALAVRYSIVDAKEAAERLRECLPPSLPVGLGGRHGPGPTGLLFAIALRAELMGEALSIGHYQTVETQGKRGDSDPAKFNDKDLDRNLRPALSWLSTWAKYALGDLDPKSIVTVIETYAKRHSYDDIWSKPNRVARQVLPLLAVASEDESVTAACRQVIQMIAADAPIVGTLDLLPGLRGDARFAEEALELSNSARQALFNTAEPADNKAETLVHIARGLHRFSPAEAGSYFDQAVNAAAGVGDDAIHRWDAIVALTRAAAGIDQVDAISLAERVAHLGETVDSVVYKGFDQRKLVAALALVSGANVLRILGQWRDRRFGMLDWQFRGLVEGDKALFASRPDLTTILAPFLTNFDLNTALRKLDASGSLNVKALSAANNLANRLGCSVDTEFAQFLLPDAPRADDTDEFRNSAFDLISEKRAERATQVQIDEYKVQIATLDLTKLNDLETAVRLQQEASLYSGSLIAEVFTRPMFQWGQILDVAVGSDALSYYELTELLNEALTRPRIAQSFVDSLQKAVTTYVDRYGARLLQQNWMIFDLSAAADLLEIRTVDLLQRALDHLNLEEALTDADHCYMLAAGASAVLDPPTAARVLREALAAFERELVVHPITVIEQAQSEPIDIAVANFLWAALGDPRSAVRWQAAHAVRTAIELGASDVIDALSSAVIRGDVAGYADGRFPYYEMNAAEWFLVAVERVSRDDPSAIDALLSAVIELSDRYPDHAIIQEHCASITRLIATPIGFVGTDWKATLAEPKVLEVRHRPTHPRPMMKGAPQSEHRFRFDFDEYVLGKLTKTLVTKHQEVLDFASTLILDDWGWRGKDGHIEDPRRTAGVYEDGETYGYKREVPKAEDLVYYLERHAALTVAGKLMRTTTPYCDPDAEQPDVLAWLADFNVARNDGRWITDQRSSVPGSLASVGPRGSNQVLESEFLTALEPTDGWVTIWQSASVTEYDRSLNIDIATALVNPETAGALARALQTADSYWSFRIPLADPGDEDFQFSSPPFQLCGWVSMPDTEGSGIDRLDPLATELMAELARPSSDIVKMFNLSSRDGGLHWENQDGVINFVSETWADISLGSELHGPSGNRLRITTEALDQTLRRLEATLIAEVRVKREDRSTRYLGISGNNDEEGDNEHDSDFRVFTYQPGTGWRDFSGRVGTR